MMILGNEETLASAVPGNLRWMGPLGIMITRNGLNTMAAKYPTPYSDEAFEAAIARVRAVVTSSTTGYILGTFSYAGVSCTCCLRYHMIHNTSLKCNIHLPQRMSA